MDDFVLIFGFPPRHLGYFEQENVRERLEKFADRFHKACSHEQNLRTDASKKTTSIGERQVEVDRAVANVAWTKANFWAAHKVAKENSYTVNNDYGSYLKK